MVFNNAIIRVLGSKILTLLLGFIHIFCPIQDEIQFENRQLHRRAFDESVTHFTDARFTNASLSAGDVHARVVTLAISCTLPNGRHSNMAISPPGISAFWDMRRISISPTLSLPVFDYTIFSCTDYLLNLPATRWRVFHFMRWWTKCLQSL